jgi:mRNA interferase RelE/StbE
MWALRYEESAAKAFRKIDRANQKRIADYMRKVCELEQPEARGKAMTANYAGHWRLICMFTTGELRISVVELGHRSSVYD